MILQQIWCPMFTITYWRKRERNSKKLNVKDVFSWVSMFYPINSSSFISQIHKKIHMKEGSFEGYLIDWWWRSQFSICFTFHALSQIEQFFISTNVFQFSFEMNVIFYFHFSHLWGKGDFLKKQFQNFILKSVKLSLKFLREISKSFNSIKYCP